MNITNQIVIEKARELGFDLVGFTGADILREEIAHLEEWLNNGYHASMDYMARNLEKRRDVRNILPNAQSIISLALNYNTDQVHDNKENCGKISRYAWGKDYHLVIWEKLELLEEYLTEIDSSFECLSYVDTGPVMDKVWAVRAGIGWMGKHTNVINRNFGSWIFLASLITNVKFEYNNPIPDLCGSCTACIDACPTNAIINEYVVDANKCISFLTIENKKEIPEELKNRFDGWLFGCDICQDVCPWNKKFSSFTGIRDFEPKDGKEIALNEIIEMNEEEFKKRFETSPIKRAKLSGLKRNAVFIDKSSPERDTSRL